MQTSAPSFAECAESASRGGGARARWMAVLALLGSLVAMPAQAMMLGQAQGTLVLGQAPHLRIPVRMDPGLPLVAQCVRADMSDGDTPVPAQQIQVSVHDGGVGGWSSIDLRGTRGLRAPFVQLTVRMGCQFQRSRSYTLLVEPSSRATQQVEPALAEGIAGTAPAAEPGRPVHRAAARRRGRRLPPQRREPFHRSVRAAAAAQARSGTPAGHPAQARPLAREAQRQAPPSHLRLDWLSRELAEQRGVAPGALAAVAPVSSAPARPGAPVAGTAARQPVPGPQASEARLMQRIDAMQQQMRALQARDAEHEHEIGVLRTRLAQASSSSGSASGSSSPSWRNSLFAALGALVALVLLLAWQNRRPRMESPWPAGMLGQGASTRSGTLQTAAVSAFGASPAPAASPMPWETPMPEAATAAPTDSALHFDREAFQRPLSLPEHVQIDEVVDHGHLAEFFIGLGDYDKAIDVMRRAVDEAGGLTSALPYLYLFDLYRRCGRRADYEQLLRECTGRLNVRIPPWDENPEQAPRDLLDYPRALALLTESWNGPARLTVVERLIADDPQKPRVGFDLPAYRDLLDLYALARELQRSQQEGANPDAARSPEALDLPLSLAATGGPVVQDPPPATAPARGIEFAESEASTLPPLDFALSTRPPQAWTH